MNQYDFVPIPPNYPHRARVVLAGLLIGALIVFLSMSCRKDCASCVLAIQNTSTFSYTVHIEGVPAFEMQPDQVEFVKITSGVSVAVVAVANQAGAHDFTQDFQCNGGCGFVNVILKQ
jgi:hypothetical protein